MKIGSLLDPKAVCADIKGRTKRAAIEEMVGRLAEAHAEIDRGEVVSALMEREKLGTTGIGDGIAIPHAKAASVPRMMLAVGRSASGIPYRSLDGRPVHLIFLLVAPPQEPGPHLQVLARLARVLRDDGIKRRLREAETEVELLRALALADANDS